MAFAPLPQASVAAGDRLRRPRWRADSALRILRRHRLDAVHARNHVPAAMALIVRRLSGCSMIFDLRGLMAEEYVDAGIWRRGGLPYRITKRIQRAAIRTSGRHRDAHGGGASATLRRSSWQAAPRRHPVLRGHREHQRPRRRREAMSRRARRRRRPVMIYVGKFTGWYLNVRWWSSSPPPKLLQPDLTFLVLTQADAIMSRVRGRRYPASDYRVARAEPEEVPRYLAAADFGLSFVRPCSRRSPRRPRRSASTSTPDCRWSRHAGIGDVDLLLEQRRRRLVRRPRACPRRCRGAAAGWAADPESRERCRRSRGAALAGRRRRSALRPAVPGVARA